MAEERISAADLMRVYNWVGRNAKVRLRWALSFAQRELDGLTPSEWTDLRWEMFAFAQFRIASDAVERPEAQDALREAGQGRRHLPMDVRLPTDRRLREAQTEYRRIVAELLRHGHVVVGPLEVRYWIVRGYTVQRDIAHPATAELSVETKGGVEGVESLAHLLGAYAHLVQVCPEPKCQRWFVAGRTNQQFCSTRCQSRHTTRAKRDRDQQAMEERRRATRRGTRRIAKGRKTKHGSPAKRRVTRKPPARRRRKS
jgi:hypothetical protein